MPSIHRSEESMGIIKKLNFGAHFIPPYTPELQCVEIVFKKIKSEIRAKYAHKLLKFDGSSGKIAIASSIGVFEPNDLMRCWNSVLKN